MSELWQNVVVAFAVLGAAAWLLRRWIRKRRAGAACERCAAAYLRTTKRPAETPSKASTR